MKTHSCLECEKKFVCEFGFCAESHSDSICKECFNSCFSKMQESDSRRFAIPKSWKRESIFEYMREHKGKIRNNRVR